MEKAGDEHKPGIDFSQITDAGMFRDLVDYLESNDLGTHDDNVFDGLGTIRSSNPDLYLQVHRSFMESNVAGSRMYTAIELKHILNLDFELGISMAKQLLNEDSDGQQTLKESLERIIDGDTDFVVSADEGMQIVSILKSIDDAGESR